MRYFNPIGAHPSGLIGELPIGVPSNLVPYITQAGIGKRKKLTVFGKDYDTQDGTCIRDYTHVEDIARAHVLAIDHMNIVNGANNYNLGSGSGSSVLEIINSAEKNLNTKVDYKIAPRRDGDPDKVFADITKVSKELDWQPKHNLDNIITHAYKWYTSDVYKSTVLN